MMESDSRLCPKIRYMRGSTATLSQPKLPDIVSLIAEPRVDWFHATLDRARA